MSAAVERELKIQRDDITNLSYQVRKLEEISSDLKTFIEIFRTNQENFKELLLDIKSNINSEINRQNKSIADIDGRINVLEKSNISIFWQLRIQTGIIFLLLGSHAGDISKLMVKLAKGIGGG